MYRLLSLCGRRGSATITLPIQQGDHPADAHVENTSLICVIWDHVGMCTVAASRLSTPGTCGRKLRSSVRQAIQPHARAREARAAAAWAAGISATTANSQPGACSASPPNSRVRMGQSGTRREARGNTPGGASGVPLPYMRCGWPVAGAARTMAAIGLMLLFDFP